MRVWQLRGEGRELTQLYELRGHASQNCVDWAPSSVPLLGAVSSDGVLSIVFQRDAQWEVVRDRSRSGILTALCWAPLPTQQVISRDEDRYHLAVVGCDRALVISYFDMDSREVVPVFRLDDCHAHWIRDVSWSSASLSDMQVLATASEDKTCRIWKVNLQTSESGHQAIACNTPVWRASWNLLGNLLALGLTSIEGKNSVHVYRENGDQKWEILSQLV